MEIEKLVSDVSALKRETDAVLNMLKSIAVLEQNRTRNMPQIRIRLKKVREAWNKVETDESPRKHLPAWADEYAKQLAATQEKEKNEFGMVLERLLAGQGIQLSGQYPSLKAGLFTIDLDFDRWQARVWYGPKQELLGGCNSTSTEVANFVREMQQRLGSEIQEKELLARLHDAYWALSSGRLGEPVPIIKVLSVLQKTLHQRASDSETSKETPRPYRRADFSFDLFRLRRADTVDFSGMRLGLVVATRAFTRKRQDFLWVPDDASGKGTTYSHLQFREVQT